MSILWLLLPISLHLSYDFNQLFINLVSGLCIQMPIYKCHWAPCRLHQSVWVAGCSICIAHRSKLIPWVSSGTCKWRGHFGDKLTCFYLPEAVVVPLLCSWCKPGFSYLACAFSGSPFGSCCLPAVYFSLLVQQYCIQAFRQIPSIPGYLLQIPLADLF